MQGTNRSGEEGEKSLLCDPGSELRLLIEGREKSKGKDNNWDGNKHNMYFKLAKIRQVSVASRLGRTSFMKVFTHRKTRDGSITRRL